MVNKVIRIISMAILGIMVGLVFSGQFHSKAARLTNPTYSYAELEAMKKQSEARRDELKQKIDVSKKSVSKEEDSLSKTSKVSAQLLTDLEAEQKNAGLVEVSGSGVEIVLGDGAKQKGSEADRSIAHAADLRDIVNVLWQNKSLAIEINGERVVWSTAIDCVVNTILINSARLAPPYKIIAIGEKEKLEQGFNEALTLKDLRARQLKGQVDLLIKQKDGLTISAYKGEFIIKKAQIKANE